MIKLQIRPLSSLSAYITRPHRVLYKRTYPTTLVYPDGSTITIRYPEPRQIIKVIMFLLSLVLFQNKRVFMFFFQLPLDLTTLSEEERKIRLDARKPKQKVKYTDDLDDSFDSKKYLKYFDKKK